MNYIHIDEINIPSNRMRREFPDDAMEELADSIWRLGQLQPVVLDDSNTLIVGERRVRAIRSLLSSPPDQSGLGTDRASSGEVLFVRRSDLDALAALEAELEENTRRLDLTWQETTAAQARLHKLRVEQKGEWSPSNPEGQRLADTAEEIFGREPTSSDKTKVSDALALSEYLDNPLVAAAPTERDAMKVLNDLHKAKQRKEAADAWDPQRSAHTVTHGDAYTYLTDEWTPLGFDVAICDPPYGRDMHKHTFESKHEYDDSKDAWQAFINIMPRLLYTHAKPQAHAYVFHDIRNFNDALVAFAAGGWSVWPIPLIWDKGNVGSFGRAALGPRHCYDAILYANKGERETVAMYSDVIKINQETSLDHPAGKPVDLYYDLLRRSVSAGMVAFDPMVGGGTFFPACHRAKVRGIGCELDEKYYHMAVEQIKELT